MSQTKTFITNSININTTSFYPRNYDPLFLLVKSKLIDFEDLGSILREPLKGGSTPPAYLFRQEYEKGIPFVKTSAINRHFININDLHNIDEDFHRTTIKRSITNPYDVIYSMTGKFMGKAALCPPNIEEMNISQNSVVLKTRSPLVSAFITIFLNSEINRIQVKGQYSITKQKYINQGKISKLKVIPYLNDYETLLEDYINALETYYLSLKNITAMIEDFNDEFIKIDRGYNNNHYSYTLKPEILSKTILLPKTYRIDFKNAISCFESSEKYCLDKDRIIKGDEIGSVNYLDEGTPFIKTSDIVNFDVDNEPDCYCSSSFVNELNQDIRKGDIVFTKDGKIGEVAIIEGDANVVLSSGFVKHRPNDDNERYWLFLLLSSNFGMLFFHKWFVVGSTMAHLRKDFFNDFFIPIHNEYIKDKYINPLKQCFIDKCYAYNTIKGVKTNVLEKFLEANKT